MVVCYFLLVSTAFAIPQTERQKALVFDPSDIVKIFQEKYRATAVNYSEALQFNLFPAETTLGVGGNLEWKNSPSWTCGFFAQTFWLLSNITGDPFDATAAALWTTGVAPVADERDTHDLGFMVFGSFGYGLRFGSGGPLYENVLIRAAHTLALRYNPLVGMTRSWGRSDDNTDFKVIVDNMMNLELLLWAGYHTQNDTLINIALSHATRTKELFVRQDGSCYHMCEFDPLTGQLRVCSTPEMPGDNTTWARGQAWGVYGFTMVYRYTKRQEFLDAAEHMAQFVMLATPSDGVPYWVYGMPASGYRDTSSTAIFSSGLIELSAITGNKTYRDYAIHSMGTVIDSYLASDLSPAVIQGNFLDCKVAGCTIIETDTYFLEAINRLNGIIP